MSKTRKISRKFIRKLVVEAKDFIEFRKLKREEIKKIRGNIIENALDIEEQLNLIVAYLFVKKGQFTFFNQFILDNIGFSKKWEIIEQYTKPINYELFGFKFDDNLRRDIKRVIEIRNMFAHGSVDFIEADVNIPWLVYRGNKKIQKIDDEFIKNTNELFEGTLKKLLPILSKCYEEIF